MADYVNICDPKTSGAAFISNDGRIVPLDKFMGHYDFASAYIAKKQDEGIPSFQDFDRNSGKYISYLMQKHHWIRVMNVWSYVGPDPNEVSDRAWQWQVRAIKQLVNSCDHSKYNISFEYHSIDNEVVIYENAPTRFLLALASKGPLPEEDEQASDDLKLIRQFHEEKKASWENFLNETYDDDQFAEVIVTRFIAQMADYFGTSEQKFRSEVLGKLAKGDEFLVSFISKIFRHSESMPPSKINELVEYIKVVYM